MSYHYTNMYERRAFLLAAEGIGQYKAYSKAEAVVEKLVEYSFGYYDGERKTWITYIESFKNKARETLLFTDSVKVIKPLIDVIKTTKNEDTKKYAAESLRIIGKGNLDAFQGLIDVFKTTDDNKTKKYVAETLEIIGKGVVYHK
ncbi:MAG: hypothetical protein MK105_17710 [Crocinitomicaceae bacterium]|nr:hypothetical protein [Crocinitomicaceae bacterium]